MTIPIRTRHLLPAALALALTSLMPVPAGAAGEPRSVSWYADHPQERAQVQLACFDDPGQLGRDPDCLNAQKASVEVALRQARARTGTMDPNDPEFWSNSPENRKSKLIMCRRTPTLDHCEAARRSLLIEAGRAGR